MKDISIIIAAHAEGVIAHKTLQSVKEALVALDDAGISHEVLVTIDNPDTETAAYFERIHNLPIPIRALPATFGELAACRNYGIEQAKGKYVAIMDADDLISANWLIEGLAIAKKEDVIVHTEYSVNFGQASIIWHKKDSLSKELEALRNIDANQWDSAIIASKKLLQRFPFMPNAKGFAPEDWHFNCQTIAAGIPHKVAPKTVLYVRRKEVSVMTDQASNKRIPHYSDLMDIMFVKDIPASVIEFTKQPFAEPIPGNRKGRIKKSALASARIAYHHSKKIPGLRRVAHHLRNRTVKEIEISRPDIPAWLIEDWRGMHRLEKLLFPSKELLATTVVYDSNMYELGICFWQMSQHITQLPTYIIFVPYLIQGGADLVAINYANYIAKLDPKQKVLVIATENIPSSWAEKLSSEVDFLPFGEIAGGLPLDLQVQMLSRLVIQSKAGTLHNIHSHKTFLMFKQYRQMFTQNPFTLLVSAFCDDVDKEGKVGGHIHSGLPMVYDMIGGILTDNAHIINQLVSEYGYDEAKFTTHYQPTYAVNNTYQYATEPFRVLWAGRVCKQKRPDILVAVAKKLAANPNIVIDAYGVLEEGYTADFFASTPNVHYQGGFNGLGSVLDKQQYQLLLYTSERDGMPNIVLEAASRGLPMVAPDVGGVKEIVTGEYLIDDPEDIDRYASQILAVADDGKALKKESKRLADLIAKRHSVESNNAFIKKHVLPRITPPHEL